MNIPTSITELILNSSKSREEIAEMFGIETQDVADIERNIKDALEDEDVNDKEFVEICEEIDYEYPVEPKKVNKEEFEKQLCQVLKNPERHDMEEWLRDAQDALENEITNIEIPSGMTNTGNPVCISLI